MVPFPLDCHRKESFQGIACNCMSGVTQADQHIGVEMVELNPPPPTPSSDGSVCTQTCADYTVYERRPGRAERSIAYCTKGELHQILTCGEGDYVSNVHSKDIEQKVLGLVAIIKCLPGSVNGQWLDEDNEVLELVSCYIT